MLIQASKGSAGDAEDKSGDYDGHRSLFKEIVGDENLGLTMHCWNSLFFWVDIGSRLLRCYDMEHKATAKFEGRDNQDGINVSRDFAVGETTSSTKSFIPQLTFNNNRLYY